MRRKLLLLLLSVAMISLCACGKSAEAPAAAPETKTETANTESPKVEEPASTEAEPAKESDGNFWDEPETGHYSINGLDLGRFPFPEFVEIASKYGGYTEEDYLCVRSEGRVRVGDDAGWMKNGYNYNIFKQSDDKYVLNIMVNKPEGQAVSELVKTESDFLSSLSSLLNGETKADYQALLDTVGTMEDTDFWKEIPLEGADPEVELLWDCYGTNSFLHLEFTMVYGSAAAPQEGPWIVNEDGHVIAEGIDLSYFPMDKLYEAAGSIGEIEYKTNSEDTFSISFSDGEGLFYRCYLRKANDGCVDLSINVDGDKFTSGSAKEMLENYSECLDKLVPAVLTEDQKTIWNTTWDEIKASDEVLSTYSFPLGEKEWWALAMGSSFQLHLDCSQPR